MMLVFHDRISTLEKALKKAQAANNGTGNGGGSSSSSSKGGGGRKSSPSSSSSSSLTALAYGDENSPLPPASGCNKRKKQR